MIKYDEHLDDRYGIKLLDDKTVRKEATASRTVFNAYKAIIQHFIDHPNPMVVPTYRFEILVEPPEDERFGIYKYCYDMKRLGMLNRNEKRLIDLLCDDHRYYIIECDKTDLAALSNEYPELTSFMKGVFYQDKYRDIHSNNFLKDTDESYKIIDLEGFYNGSLMDPRNNWMTK